jgi:ribose-phosphate pyrophosphokinase
MLGECLEALGVDRIVTIDVHAEQSQGFIKGPWDNLYGSFVLVPELLKLQRDFVVVSPDSGGVRRATHYVDVMDALGIAMAAKRRDHKRPGKSRVLTFAGDVEGMPALVVDDVFAGGGTVFGASEVALEHGATEVFAAAPHGLFLGDFLQRLSHSQIKMVYTTDTVQHPPEVLNHPKIQVVPIASLIAAAIPRICTGRSISQDLFLHPNHR